MRIDKEILADIVEFLVALYLQNVGNRLKRGVRIFSWWEEGYIRPEVPTQQRLRENPIFKMGSTRMQRVEVFVGG